MNPQPLIAVKNVALSSNWYQKLLDCESGHGGKDYEQLMFNGHMILQLHLWDAHEHPYIGDSESKPYGNGVLLWFQTDAYEAAMERVYSLGTEIIEEPHINQNANHRECWLRDPDGYVVVLASAYGDVGDAQ